MKTPYTSVLKKAQINTQTAQDVQEEIAKKTVELKHKEDVATAQQKIEDLKASL